jgi:hypothetical protein
MELDTYESYVRRACDGQGPAAVSVLQCWVERLPPARAGHASHWHPRLRPDPEASARLHGAPAGRLSALLLLRARRPARDRGRRASELGHYPHHYVMHLMHCYEVVAYLHPVSEIRGIALEVYRETKSEMLERLTEDRMLTGEVVS